MRILALDPGTEDTGFVVLQGREVIRSGVLSNSETNQLIRDMPYDGKMDMLAIEMIASYGMPVGKEVFETCLWIGRFLESWERATDAPSRLVYRKDVKSHLCGTQKAKDANIRQRLIDIFGPIGKKSNPGALYGVKSHAWAALAVAVTAQYVVTSPDEALAVFGGKVQ